MDGVEIGLKIDGMTCGGCKAAVERILAAQPGVKAAAVDLESGHAAVTASADIAPQTLVAAVERAGYQARIEI